MQIFCIIVILLFISKEKVTTVQGTSIQDSFWSIQDVFPPDDGIW